MVIQVKKNEASRYGFNNIKGDFMDYKLGSSGDVLVIPVLKDEILDGHRELMEYLKEKEIFAGKKGEIYSDLVYKGSNVILLGMGEEDKISSEVIRLMFFKAGKELADKKVSDATVILKKYPDLCYRKTAIAAYEGLYNSQYKFNKYKSPEKPAFLLGTIGFQVMEGKEDKITEALKEAVSITEGITLARNLVNEPSEYIYPETLAEEAKKELEPLGVEVEVLNKEEIEKLGMTAFLAVARGSLREPKLIVMRWKNGGDSDVIGLVGKGLTYDSGGYAIKQPQGMASMHTDMGGGAGVIGAMKTIAMQKLPKNVTAVVAACENMISGGSYKNGDIIRSMSGKTIEIVNTDAEGRVTLADSIYYTAKNENAAEIIDVATLTGAVIVALGSTYIGAVTNNQEMMDKVLEASKVGGEKVWQLPSDDDYKDMVKGQRADLVNSVQGGAGSITAGMFLENFAEGKKWVHLDIAGVASLSKASGYKPVGASGWPVKTLYYYCKGEGQNHHKNQ